MIRLTILVVSLYGICCAMAWGDVTPAAPDPSNHSGNRSTPAAVEGASRFRSPGDSGPVTMDHGGSLVRATLQAAASPNSDVVGYNAASSMAVPDPVPRVLKKHDLVTIIVREESQSGTKGTTDLKKNADFDAKIDSYVKLNLAKVALNAQTPTVAPELKLEGTRNFKGDAQVDRTDTFTARIGAEVLDVKPNGTLVIQARKHIKNDEEEQELILTGTCRAEDVGPDNSILSNTLNDLDVRKVTKGAARDTTKRGFLPRLLDTFSPF